MKSISIFDHPERNLFFELTTEESGRRSKPPTETTLQEIKEKVKDLPHFLGHVFSSGHPEMVDLVVKNFPDAQPIIRFVSEIKGWRRELLKKHYLSAYRAAIRWEFAKHFSQKVPLCLPPTPDKKVQKIEFNKTPGFNEDDEDYQNVLEFDGKEYEYKISVESFIIDGEVYKVMDAFKDAKFEFESSKYHFRESFIFEKPIFGSNILYSGLYIEETDVKEVDIDFELLKKQFFKAHPEYYDYIHGLSLDGERAEFWDGMATWTGTFKLEKDRYSEKLLIDYTKFNGEGSTKEFTGKKTQCFDLGS